MTTFTSWDSELYHHGIKGQRWGVRRYMNKNGSLTKLGEKRYGGLNIKKPSAKRVQKDLNTFDKRRLMAEAKSADRVTEKGRQKWKDRASTIKQMSDIILDYAQRNGYTISSKEVRRRIATGKHMSNGRVSTTYTKYLGTKYKIEKT